MRYFGALILILNATVKCSGIEEFGAEGIISRRDVDKVLTPTHHYELKIPDDFDGFDIVGLMDGAMEDIYRPCKLGDWSCARKFLATNSHCVPKYGSPPDPLLLEEHTVYYPNVNLTLFLKKFITTGLSNVNLREFYVNKETGNLVLAMDFRNLNLSAIASFIYHRMAKDDIVLTDYIDVNYKAGTLTAVIPKVPHLRLDKADIHINFDNDYDIFIGPAATNSTDPDVIRISTGFMSNLSLHFREGIQGDEKEDIYRPCKFKDWECIRNFLAINSNCKITYGLAPDPLVLKSDTVYLPFVNVTVVLENVQTSGLNSAKVIEFYVNKKTGNVVFAVDIFGLSERSTYTTLIYKRTGKEPIIKTDYSTVTYERITFTAVIPNVPHLKLQYAGIHADISDSAPPYTIGNKAYNSTDEIVQRAFLELSNALPISLREAFSSSKLNI